MRGRWQMCYRVLVLLVALGLWLSLNAPTAAAKSKYVEPIVNTQGYTWSGGAMP